MKITTNSCTIYRCDLSLASFIATVCQQVEHIVCDENKIDDALCEMVTRLNPSPSARITVETEINYMISDLAKLTIKMRDGAALIQQTFYCQVL